MITFSKKIKEEICHNKYHNETKKNIIYSFLKNSYEKTNNNNLVIKSRSATIVRFIVSIIQDLFIFQNKNVEIESIKNKGRLYKLIIKISHEDLNEIIFLNKKIINSRSTKLEKQGCLIGAFLSKGSVNNPNKSNYHLEIKITNELLLKEISFIFKQNKIDFKILEKNKDKIIYVKKSEQISDLLKYIEAYNCMLEYEDKRICRDYSNQIYRLNNLDMSNLKKIIDNSNKQIFWIKEIKKHSLVYSKFNENEKLFCELRLKNECLSLNEIAEIFREKYNKNLSKSALNHYSRKIKITYLNEIQNK